MHHRSLEELGSWALTELCEGIDSGSCNRLYRFEKPHPGFWPDDPGAIFENLNLVYHAQEVSKRLAFYAYCLASALCCRETKHVFQALERFFRPEDLGLPLKWDDLSSIKWLCLPVPVSDNQKGRIAHIFLGDGPVECEPFLACQSENGESLLDDKAMEAVYDAAKLSGFTHFTFWLPPIFETPLHISGKSLGLPVYLGFKFLEKNGVWPELLCSGILEPSGKVLAVEGLDHKIAAAQDAGYSGFIFPDQNNNRLAEIRENNFDLISVPDVETALVLAECHVPGSGNAQVNFYRNRQNIETVIVNIGRINISLLKYLESKEQFLSRFIRDETAACGRQNDLLCRIEGNGSSFSNEDLTWLLEQLFPVAEVQKLIENQPTIAWQAICLHLRLANHQGLIRKFQTWEKVAQHCLQYVPREREVDKDRLLWGIYSIINGYHNQYDFSPKIFQEKIEPLAPFISEIEERWRRRRKEVDHAVEKILGEFYGTLAQHYGFCGLHYHKESEKYTCKALDAFGNGKVRAYEADWRRVFSYRFFCRLDAGDINGAYEALKYYLGDDPREIQYDRLKNSFEHFLLARYLAESAVQDKGYVEWAQQNQLLKNCPKDHPWPLWALNMGRIHDDARWKKICWETSLRLCLQNRGPTIQMMGLMPIARLAAENLAEEDFLKAHIMKILNDCHNSGLNQEHFNPLWVLPWHDVAKKVLDNVAHYFPFSYR